MNELQAEAKRLKEREAEHLRQHRKAHKEGKCEESSDAGDDEDHM